MRLPLNTFKRLQVIGYDSTDVKEQTMFNNFLSTMYDTIQKCVMMASRQCMNANVGVRNNKKECNQIGTFGLNNKNRKCVEAVNLLRTHNIYAPLKFYSHK